MSEANAENQYSLQKNDFFVRKASLKFIVNSVISTLFIFAGSFIDTLIVGIFLGENGLSAMSLVSPVYLVFYTVGATVGIGASIFASRVLGRGDVKEYKKIFTCATVVLAVAAVVMVLVFYIFFNGITNLLCGDITGVQKQMFKDYLKFYIPGGAFTLMSYIPLYFLKTDGRPKASSTLFMISTVLNIILTALFMSPVCKMGIAGASFATTVSMSVVAVLGFVVILKGKTELGFVRRFFSFKSLKEIAVSGVPNGLSNLLESAQIILINMLLINTGFTHLLPCYTVLRNVMGLISSVVVGMSSALLPLIGVFFGERDYDSEREVIKGAVRIGLTVMIPLVVVFSLLSNVFFRVFNVSDAAVIAEGRFALPLACVGMIFGYINAFYTSYMTAIKREWTATLLVALRTFVLLAVFGIPLAYLVGSKGIWFSFTVCEVATLLSFILLCRIIRKRNPKYDSFLLDTSLERDGDISFSVKNKVDDIVFASQKCSEYCEEHEVDMKRCMKVSLAIEELLTFLLGNCLGTDKDQYVDVRVCKLDEEVMLRFRYVGEIFDPVSFYKKNSTNSEMTEELLGLKMIFKSASLVNFKQTLGANNLMLIF